MTMGAVKEPVASLYDADFIAWTQQQAAALLRGAWRELDIENLVEEVESMGRQQQAEFVNRLAQLLAHLLKWKHQPQLRPTQGRPWRLTVLEQRRQLLRLMLRNPSLKSFVAEGMREAYGDAVLIAARESGLDVEAFGNQPAWEFAQVMADDWMPE
jgi:hypothetical protein